MSIDRWEMLLSSKSDRYLLKIRGDKADVDKLVRAHQHVCHEPQEIRDLVYQWVVFVVDANLNERLAIQNQLLSMVRHPTTTTAAAKKELDGDLSNVISELSNVLEELTGLTDEEEARVMEKVQEIQRREAQSVDVLPPPPVTFRSPFADISDAIAKTTETQSPTPPPPPPSPPTPPPPPPKPVEEPPIPAEIPIPFAPPPTAEPMPISLQPVQPQEASPVVPEKEEKPKDEKEKPAEPETDKSPLNILLDESLQLPPSATKPKEPSLQDSIVSSSQPPEQVSDKDQAFSLSESMDKIEPPLVESTHEAVSEAQKPPPAPPKAPEEQSHKMSLEEYAQQDVPVDISRVSLESSSREEKKEKEEASPPPVPQETSLPEPPPLEKSPESLSEEKPDKKTPEEDVTVPLAAPLPDSAAMTAIPPVFASPVVDMGGFGEMDFPEDQVLRCALFYPEGAESSMQKFLSSLTDIAQKKAKKPIFVRPVLSQVTIISNDNTTEWIWSAKSAGADCFFVILPPDILPDFMETSVSEARAANLYCFLIPQNEIVSRLLYVDLMVEMMLIKRKK